MTRLVRPTTNYPGVQQVPDSTTQLALRILHDQLASLRDSTLPLRGTLQPDQKPLGLGREDQGLLFYSADYDRLYRWNGSGWEDAIGQSGRGVIGYFWAAPGPGWVLCDGRAADMTTADGSLIRRPAPVLPALNGLQAYLRL